MVLRTAGRDAAIFQVLDGDADPGRPLVARCTDDEASLCRVLWRSQRVRIDFSDRLPMRTKQVTDPHAIDRDSRAAVCQHFEAALPFGHLDSVPAVGISFRDRRLFPGERLVWQVPCNWQQRGVARGGRLGLTPQALVFEPTLVDRST